MPAFELPEPELFWTSLQWLVIACMWGVLAWGTWREDRRIRQLHNSPVPPSELVSLLQMLHQRHVQIGILVTLLLVAEAVGDLRRSMEAQSSASTATAASSTSQPTPAAPTAGAPKPAAKATLPQDLPFSDITEFNEQNSKEQAYIDWLKQHYEAWLVTYYYLNKCGQAGPQDLNVIEQSLQNDLDNAHADATARDNILLAATGSYKEMYSNIPCDSRRISTTKSTYDASMLSLKLHTSPTPAANQAPEPSSAP